MAANPVEVNLLSLLSALESKTAKLDDKIETFNNFNNNLNEGDLSLFTEDVGKEKKRVLAVARRDALADNDKLSQQALQVLGFCLHDVEISRSLAAGEVTEIVGEICSIIRQTKDKTTCTRALWCLSRQSLPVYHLSEQVGSILTAVGEAMDKWKGQSNTVEFEAVNTLARLQAQMSRDMEASVGRYLKLVFPLLSHNAVKIRELSLEVMEMAADQITDENGVEFRQALMADLKGGKWLGELKKLFQTKNETYILTVWSLLVRLLGKELHHGSFINNILSVPEMGFKSTSATVKCAAFDAWRHLIDNFGLNHVIIGDAKRVKLIMQVFKINNAKVESVAEKKLSVWWHFIQKLDSKISMYFDQVCVPLLQMCVGGPKLAGSANQTMATPTFSRAVPGKLAVGASPVTPRLGLPNSSTNTPVFPAIQLQGCQILAHILGAIPADIDIPRVHFSVPPLRVEVMTGPAFFVKQSTIILSCAKELLAAQGKQIQDGLLYHIWYALVAHVKNVVESGAKSESRDVLTTFLGHFQLLVITEVMEYARLLKLFEAVVCLPRKALCSTAYQMGAGEVLHGTPVLFLTELLLTPKLLEACSASEKYMSLLSMLIEIGVSHGGVLEFSQVILHTLARHAEFTESDQLWRMWSTVVSQLLEHIKKTNEVNQGDVLEHDFTCMYAALMFPLKHLLTCRLSQSTTKTLLKTWTELYTTFSRLSSMVTNAEANVSCEQLCHQILAAVDFDTIQEVSFLDALTSMMEVVVGQVDFSSLGAPKPFSAHLSPSRWMKRKQRPLENIHSLVMLVSRTIECLQTLAGAVSNNTKTKSLTMTTIQATVSCILGVLTVLFTHVTSSHIIASMIEKLAQPMAEIFQSPSFRSFPSTFQQKLERLWLDIATCLQSRYTGGFDSDFLSQLSPLLEATFSHPRRQIKTQAVMLWNATFSKSPPLRYPESLRPVLLRVKEKTPLLLPGWISTDIPVVEETPVSQFSQAGCSAPEARLPGMPSPHKIRGSFLNKAVSPNIKKSPARVVSPKAEGKSPAHSKAKKNLSLFDMRDEEFVVISASPKQKRVLTEHQKEVLKERKSLPAMYNNLELSQDVSLSSQFMTDTQPEKLSQSDSVIVLDSESQKMAPPPPVTSSITSNQVEKSEEHPPPVKRRRSIRFSDEVFEKPSSAENKTQEHMQMSNCTLPGKSKSDTSKSDANSLNKSKDTSVGVETPIVSFANQIKSSSSSQESVLSVKGNLQHAMGGLLSDISSSSFEKSAGSLGSEKNDEIPSTKDSLKGVSAEWGKSSGSSTRNSSLSQLFSCPDDSVPHTSLNSVNMDSLVEDTQEMFSPPKSEPEPLVKDSVMETPVKSVDESIVFSGTPASRALFDRQASNGAENNEVFDSHVDPSGRVSPVVKIQRLSGEAIRRYSPSRSQSTEDDDKVRSQLVQSDSKPARVRRSLSHPESGKFGGELQSMVSDVGSLGSPIELSGQQSVPESPDSQSSQGFLPGDLALEGSANSSQGGEGLPEQPEELMDETGDMTLRENIKDLCSESFLTSSQASIPNLGASTLKNSTDLFSEISAVEASANESSETPSQIHSMASSNGSQDDQQSYNPELQSTMISSSEIKTRRKSYTAPKAAETTQDKKPKRKSLPNSQPAKEEPELAGMRTRHANKSESEKVELSQTLRRGRSGEQNVDHVTPANNKGDKKSSDSTGVGRKTRSSCVGIVENADGKNEEESSQDKIDKTLKKTEKSKEVVKTRNSCLKAIEQTVGNCEESSQDRIDNKTPKHQKPSKAISKSTANNSASTPGRGVKRPRKTRGSKAESSIHDTEVKDSLSSDEDEITFNFPNKVLKSDGNTNTADNIRLVEIPPDKTPDSREIVHKEPVRLSTSLVKKEQSKSTGSTPRSNTPKARKSLTAADPFGSDSDENLPLSNYSSQESSKTNSMVDPVTEDLPNEKCEEGKSDEKTIAASEVHTDGVNGGSSLEGSLEKELPSTPSRGPPKYKVAKSSPMSKRLRSAQKSDKPDPTENTASPRSATKGRRLSLTRKKLDVCGADEPQQSSEEGKEKSLSESGRFTSEKQPEETVSEKMLCESNENITELESEKQGPSTKLSVEDVKENVPTNPVSEENKQNDDGNFTEIKSLDKKSNRVRFAEGELLEQVQSDDVLSTPKSAAPGESLCQSDSKLHGPKRLSFPLSDREACKTSPRGILKRRSLGKTASNILPRTRGFYSPWSSRGLHPGRRIHPITTARACSPSASPSASILKRRRLSGDVATNSPSPPSKQRRVSFADPVSVAKEMTSSESQGSDLMSGKGQVQVNRCLNLPAPICPVVSQNKKSALSQSESSCGSTQESQLGCTGPVYPQLQQCSKPVETVLPQLTSSIWSRGLEQLVRSRNIRTVGDLCTLSEYEVHNLPIRSPKVPTLRRVLRQFESRSEKRVTAGVSSGISSLITAPTKTVQQSSVESYTPPGSPTKAAVTETPSSLPSQSLLTIKDRLPAIEENAGAEGVTEEGEEEALPAVEDALSQLSPVKDDGDLNASTDDETEVTESEKSVIPNQQPVVNATVSSDQTNSADVNQSNFLKTIEECSVRFTSEEIQRFGARDIFRLHSHLTTLLNAAVKALGPKCGSPESQ